MRRKALIAFVVLAVAFAFQSTLAGVQAPKKRQVALSITTPAAPEAKGSTITLEGEMTTMGIKDVGLFGFTPVPKKGDDKTMVVTISDAAAKPAAELGTIEVPIGGDAVTSKTKPPFSVKILSVK